MIKQQDISLISTVELSQLIHSKKISPLEILEFYAPQIEAKNPSLGAFVYVNLEQAFLEAKEKTEILAQVEDTSSLPFFFGIPTAIKDLYCVKGMPTGYGNGFIKDQIADYDSGITAKIKQAGFIIVGKTATSELGSLPYTESLGLSPCRSPHNPDYTAGGSSGGGACAVAGGLLPIAPGSDGGGSVRGPAFCCGIVGLKPSRGRVSNAPVGDYQGGIATHGCLSRNVADSAALLDAISGYITGDPYWLPNPDTSFLCALSQDTGKLKIAFATSILPAGEANPIIQTQVGAIASKLEAMGHELTEACPDFTPLVDPFKIMWQSGIASAGFPDEILNPMNQWLKETSPDLGTYLRALHQMQVISRQIVAFFDNFDVLLLPTYMSPPIKIGEWADLPPEKTLENIIHWINPCPPFNATGQPAIALSTGFTENNLPIGIQLVGKPAEEKTILQLAYQLEQM